MISAVDHVIEYGDQPDMENVRRRWKNCRARTRFCCRASCCSETGICSPRAAPGPSLRINWSLVLLPAAISRRIHHDLHDAEEAVAAAPGR